MAGLFDFLSDPTDTGILPSRRVRGSWYSQYPGWVDNQDRPGSNALGVPDEQQGIALPTRHTLGQWFDVTAPNGQTLRLQQTDIGPHPRTGRGIDISAAAGNQFGYTPDTFPTDAAFSYAPTGDQGGGAQMPANAQLTQGATPPGIPSPVPQQGIFDRVMNNPLVLMGLGLASGKTATEGIGNALQMGLYNQEQQRQTQARTDTARALANMGLSPDMARVAANNPDLLKVLAPELYAKPTWGVVRENPDQTKVYGWIDPRQQTVKPADATAESGPGIPGASISRPPIGGGTGADIPPPQQQNTKEPTPLDMPFSGGAYGSSPLPSGRQDAYIGLSQGLRGQALFDSLPNRLQDGVMAYLDGRVQTGVRTTGEMAYIKRLAQSVDPQGADDTTIAERKKFRTELGSNSMQSVGGNLNTGKTAIKHLSEIADMYTKIGNQSAGAAPFLSQFSNAAHIALSQDKRSVADALEAGAQKYAGEAGKYYGGSAGGTGKERGDIEARFSPSLPPDQAAMLLEKEKAFLLDKVQTQLDTRDRIFGPLAQRDPKLRDLLDSHTQEAVKKIDDAIVKLRGKAQEGRYFRPKQPEAEQSNSGGAPARSDIEAEMRRRGLLR